jgi:hypothetical protein
MIDNPTRKIFAVTLLTISIALGTKAQTAPDYAIVQIDLENQSWGVPHMNIWFNDSLMYYEEIVVYGTLLCKVYNEGNLTISAQFGKSVITKVSLTRNIQFGKQYNFHLLFNDKQSPGIFNFLSEVAINNQYPDDYYYAYRGVNNKNALSQPEGITHTDTPEISAVTNEVPAVKELEQQSDSSSRKEDSAEKRITSTPFALKAGYNFFKEEANLSQTIMSGYGVELLQSWYTQDRILFFSTGIKVTRNTYHYKEINIYNGEGRKDYILYTFSVPVIVGISLGKYINLNSGMFINGIPYRITKGNFFGEEINKSESEFVAGIHFGIDLKIPLAPTRGIIISASREISDWDYYSLEVGMYF